MDKEYDRDCGCVLDSASAGILDHMAGQVGVVVVPGGVECYLVGGVHGVGVWRELEVGLA